MSLRRLFGGPGALHFLHYTAKLHGIQPVDGVLHEARHFWAKFAVPRRVDGPTSMITLQSLISNFGEPMASITIRNLDERTKERLRIRAAHQGRSMEDEARNILRTAVAKDAATPRNLAQAIRSRFEPLGGVELAVPAREPMRKPPQPGR